MLFALFALVIMLVGSVALMRTLNISLFNAGNIGFKRDMSNQSEQVLSLVLAKLKGTGPLATPADRAQNLQASNYRAKAFVAKDGEVNAQGIPYALLRDADFNAVGLPANDIDVADQHIKIRYVVDRLCNATGPQDILGAPNCVLSQMSGPAGGSSYQWQNAADSSGGLSGAAQLQVVYRVSVRVSGPRDTQSFFQTTFSL